MTIFFGLQFNGRSHSGPTRLRAFIARFFDIVGGLRYGTTKPSVGGIKSRWVKLTLRHRVSWVMASSETVPMDGNQGYRKPHTPSRG
jgi:hypothetical protein